MKLSEQKLIEVIHGGTAKGFGTSMLYAVWIIFLADGFGYNTYQNASKLGHSPKACMLNSEAVRDVLLCVCSSPSFCFKANQ